MPAAPSVKKKYSSGYNPNPSYVNTPKPTTKKDTSPAYDESVVKANTLETAQRSDLTQYANDYQAEINRRAAINPNDPTIAQLNALRDQKKSDIAAGVVTSTGEPTWIGSNPGLPNKSIGNTGAITSSDYYEKMLAEQQKAIQERTNAAVNANNAYIPQINQRSDQALQNAYISREQNRIKTPQALNALGYSGGPTETELNRMNLNYENSRNTIETERQNALTGIQQNEQQIRATGDATKADAAADYYNNLVSAVQQAEAQAQDQANWEAEFALQQQQYSDAAAQQAWQNEYDNRLYELQKANAGKSSSSSSSGLTASQINSMYQSGLISEEEARSMLGYPVSTSTGTSGIRQSVGAVSQSLTPANYSYRDVYNSIVPNRTPEGVRAAAQRLLAQGANPSYVEEALRSLGYQ